MSNLSDVMSNKVCLPEKIPVDWIWVELTQVCRPKQWKTISSSEMTMSGYPVFGANGYVGFYTEYNHVDETIAITCRGNTCGTINRIPAKTYITGNSMALDDVEDKIITQDYLYHSLTHRSVSDAISGSAQPQITGNSLKQVRFPLAPLLEQQKIAAILTSVDEVIEKTQAQIDKLKDLKNGMMQELLTKGVGIKQGEKYMQHTEFKDSPAGKIPEVWAVTKLSKLINVMESGWSPQCESTPAPNGEWCILKTTAVSWNGFNPSANKKLPNELEPRPQIQVKANDILITRAGPAERVGVISHVDFVPEKVMLSDKIIRIQTNRCISKFLSLWLSSSFVQKYLASRVSGLAMSQTNISQSILQNIFCVIPPFEEQQAITNTINSLEVRFIATEKKLNSLILMKKALMQDLLTGKVRVKVDNDLVV